MLANLLENTVYVPILDKQLRILGTSYGAFASQSLVIDYQTSVGNGEMKWGH